MISTVYRESLPSLDGMMLDQHATGEVEQDPHKDSAKRVKHGPTTIIQIDDEKRRKVSTSVTASHVVEAITKAISYEERQDAICTATVCFDHNMLSLHDEELEVGADAILLKHLGFLMSRVAIQPKASEPSLMQEIGCTCEALEMVYRASPQSVLQSFNRIGLDLLATLIYLINQQISNRVTELNQRDSSRKMSECTDDNESELDDENSHKVAGESRPVTPPSTARCPPIADESNRRDTDDMLRKATKVIGHFARVGAATQPMAFYPGLLSCLVNILAFQPYTIIPSEARLNSLWIIANLACNSENMVMMACHPHLMTTLIAMAGRRVHSRDSVEVAVEVFRSQSIASRALVNLSWAPENRIPMSENSDLLDVLTTLAVLRQSAFGKTSRTIRDMMLQTRTHSVGTLRNIAASARRSKILLCQHNQGNILNVLTDAALNDPDNGVKARAFSTIQNLAIHDTAAAMVQNPALILALKDALLSDDDYNDERDGGLSFRESASATLMVLERSITPDNPAQYQTLRELLSSLNPSDDTEDEMTSTAV